MSAGSFSEMGPNLIKIANALMDNSDFMKLLYYTNKDPLGETAIPEKKEILHNLLRVIPIIPIKDNEHNYVTIRAVNGRINQNTECLNYILHIEIFVPLTQWVIRGQQLRPFALMGEVSKTLRNMEIEGFGRLDGGTFQLNFVTEEMSAYEMVFGFTAFV